MGEQQLNDLEIVFSTQCQQKFLYDGSQFSRGNFTAPTPPKPLKPIRNRGSEVAFRRHKTTSIHWQQVSDYCLTHGVNHLPGQCQSHWEYIYKEFNKIKSYEYHVPTGKKIDLGINVFTTYIPKGNNNNLEKHSSGRLRKKSCTQLVEQLARVLCDNNKEEFMERTLVVNSQMVKSVDQVAQALFAIVDSLKHKWIRVRLKGKKELCKMTTARVSPINLAMLWGFKMRFFPRDEGRKIHTGSKDCCVIFDHPGTHNLPDNIQAFYHPPYHQIHWEFQRIHWETK
ncbi:hypothetical protein SELMODRAFT_412243 [Selaginella moellendorffii]|uniref:Uncharacterized protein n=1 Tax=Selaginella moellendorffii TaxID=88036 RepID=D8RKI9_SELML|nr:hypothetical protein SELMODRAFT_412243 [Selaginella moellendorffii]